MRGPSAAEGHVLLGYDERGHCPMLVDGRCSIYEHRPRTCRTYDCRVFVAAGVPADEDDKTKTAIARRANRWRFSYGRDAARAEHEAVRGAAAALGAKERLSATQLAVLAVEREDRSPDA